MNRATFATLCALVPLALSALGLLTHTDMLATLKNWANRPAAIEHQQAQALRPVIDCINRVDSSWRVAYFNYRNRTPQANDPSLAFIDRFPELYQRRQGQQLSLFDYDAKRADLCRLTSSQLSALQQYLPTIAGLSQRYIEQLTQVYAAAQRFDFYPSAAVPGLKPDDRVVSDARFFPIAERFLNVSSELRSAVDEADRHIRAQQLRDLQARGRHQMAFVPGLIQQTRETMQSLDPHSPEQLSDAQNSLQAAWDGARQYLRADQPNPNPEAQALWNRVRQPGNDYLKALQRLAVHAHAQVGPERLSADVFEVQRRFDLLVDAYNQAVGQDY